MLCHMLLNLDKVCSSATVTYTSFCCDIFPEIPPLFPEESLSDVVTNPILDLALSMDDLVGLRWLLVFRLAAPDWEVAAVISQDVAFSLGTFDELRYFLKKVVSSPYSVATALFDSSMVEWL